jgi:hypothetical protein
LGNLASYLADELGIPVEALPVAGEALAGLALEEGRGSVLALGLGLALREGLPPGERLPLNFRQGRFEHAEYRSWIREKILGIVALAACLVCALGGWLGSYYVEVAQRHDAAQAAMQSASKALFGEVVNDPGKIRKKLSGGGDATSLVPSRSAYDHYYQVYSRIPEGVELRFYDLEVDLFRQIIKVNAETDSAASVDQFVESLERDECFKGQVKKGATKSSGELVSFDLTISPKCSAQRLADANKKK